MAGSTVFPTSIDSFYLPTTSNTLLTAGHADRHQELALAVAAIETKVGVNSSAVTTSLDYKLKNSASLDPGHLHSANGFNTSLLSGWFDVTETWTYASSVSFTVSGDQTARFQPGDKLRWKQGGAYKYGWVKSSSYSNPTTTVTTLSSTLYTIANAAITNNGFSKMATPAGFPITENFNARAYRSNASSITSGSYQKINFDTATYNPGSYFDPVTNCRYTCPVDGYYEVVVNTGMQAVPDGSRLGSAIYKNGSQVTQVIVSEGALATASVASVDTLKCVASDYIEGFVFQNSGGNLSLNNASTDSYITVTFRGLAF